MPECLMPYTNVCYIPIFADKKSETLGVHACVGTATL